jgi:ABC-type amino acid transport system permease subunit
MTATERDRLIVVEEKIKSIDEKLDKVIKDHEERIRTLEQQPGKSWSGAKTTLIAAIIAGVVGVVIGALSKLIG